eukprot:405490-Rhodomonas_salina.1
MGRMSSRETQARTGTIRSAHRACRLSPTHWTTFKAAGARTPPAGGGTVQTEGVWLAQTVSGRLRSFLPYKFGRCGIPTSSYPPSNISCICIGRTTHVVQRRKASAVD